MAPIADTSALIQKLNMYRSLLSNHQNHVLTKNLNWLPEKISETASLILVPCCALETTSTGKKKKNPLKMISIQEEKQQKFDR